MSDRRELRVSVLAALAVCVLGTRVAAGEPPAGRLELSGNLTMKVPAGTHVIPVGRGEGWRLEVGPQATARSEIQVQATPFLAPGIEFFYQTPSAPPSLAPGTPSEIGRSAEIHFNVGFVLDFGENHHLLFSAGRAFYGCNCDHLYVAYLLTIGAKP